MIIWGEGLLCKEDPLPIPLAQETLKNLTEIYAIICFCLRRMLYDYFDTFVDKLGILCYTKVRI